MTTQATDWDRSPLEQVTSLIKDGSHGTHQDVPEGIPLLSAKDVGPGILYLPDDCRRISEKDYAAIHKNYVIEQNDILLTLVGTIGRCCRITRSEPRFTIQRSVGVIRPRNIDPSYLYHYLQGERFQSSLKDSTNASAQGGVYLGALAKCSVDYPIYQAEQAKIAEVLSTVDQTIEQAEALIAKQQRIKTGLMQDLLSRGIDENGNIRSEQTHQFKDSPLGRIPVEWEAKAIGEIARVRSGTTPSRANPDFWEEGMIPWVKTGEVNFREILQTEERITPTALSKTSLHLEPVGTVLVAMYGQGGTRGRCGFLGIEATTNQACAAIVGHKDKVHQNYLYQCLVSQYSELRTVGHGSNQVNLSGRLLSEFKIRFPSLLEQKRIADSFAKIDAQLDVHRQQLGKTSLLKVSLMQDLLSGKKSVTSLLEPESIS